MSAKNAPGKSFRNAISLIDLFEVFPDDATAEAWFVDARWREGVRCDHCDSDNVSLDSKHPAMPYHCRECRLSFSAKTNTVPHIQAGLSQVGLGYPHRHHGHQRYFRHETSPDTPETSHGC